MTKRIQHQRSSSAGAVPVHGDLVIGELFVNLADKVIYTKDESNAVLRMSGSFIVSASDLSDPKDGDAYLKVADGKLRAFYSSTWHVLNPDADLSSRVAKAGDTMSGQLTLPGGGAGSEAITVTEAAALDTTLGNLKVSKAGDTMSGQLTLPGGGTGDQAVTRNELDDAVDIATPDLTAYLPKAGGVMSGQITLPGGGTGNQAASMTQVAAAIASHAAAGDPHPGYTLETAFVAHVGAGGAAHANATTGVAGFMSSADKTALNGLVAGSGIPAGAMFPYAGATEPSGYLFCRGQAIGRLDFPDLFAVISTLYGVGDGSTTFNLPDIRGRVVAGQDDMGGVSANRLTGLSGGVNGDTLGAVGGAESHTLALTQIPAHTHTVQLHNSAGGSGSIEGNNGSSPSVAINSGSAGGGQAHNNVQPTIILNYVIKT